MLALSHNCRYFLYRQPTDMRYGIHSLAGLVQNELHFDPMGGDVLYRSEQTTPFAIG
jgi:transposase